MDFDNPKGYVDTAMFDVLVSFVSFKKGSTALALDATSDLQIFYIAAMEGCMIHNS